MERRRLLKQTCTYSRSSKIFRKLCGQYIFARIFQSKMLQQIVKMMIHKLTSTQINNLCRILLMQTKHMEAFKGEMNVSCKGNSFINNI